VKYVKCPDYVTKNEYTGAIEALQCKICGTTIADTVERIIGYEMTRGGQRIKVVNRQFTRLPNYREVKIEFDDSSNHVTNGCDKCLSMNLHPSVLAELHEADQLESPDGYTDRERARYPVGVITIAEQSGIA
jgi:hypothetical protein